ncbi:MAG: galactokinase [Acholeplasmatales bacterium]|jgi:galactokinase|nr:galactokinase [Acholeplasmatales bacterium]
MNKTQLELEFREVFNKDGKVIFSPGRVNLIGEHIDYNGGYVFPFAIDLGIWGCYSKNNSNHVRILSKNFSSFVYEFDILNFEKTPGHWSNYIKGMIDTFNNNGYKVNDGFDLIMESTMPEKSGLSSSASLEMLIGLILSDVLDVYIDSTKLSLLGKEAENKYVGVSSGIMDQFAVANGKKDNAIFLNTKTLDFQLFPLVLKEEQILIINSNVKRELTTSKYNERVSECIEGLKYFKKMFPFLENLCELSIETVFENENKLPDVIYRRVKHVVSEQKRTIDMKEALIKNDIKKVELLLHESHLSLANDYEVSCKELNVICNIAMENGYNGFRMTGAGFGGCVIGIVPKDRIEEMEKIIEKNYFEQTGLHSSIYRVTPADGTRIIE